LRSNDILNLLNLQGVIKEKEKFPSNLTEFWIKYPIKENICPVCHTSTSRVHDYYLRTFTHIIFQIHFKCMNIAYLKKPIKREMQITF